MSNLSRIQRTELRACKTETISDCGLTAAQLKTRIGNPAGVGKSDAINPSYKGKVVHQGGRLHINLSYILTGNIQRAEIGLKNIRDVYASGGVVINLKPSASKFDIRIHGASLSEITQGLKLCTCEAGLYIGGWAPSPQHFKWGNALLLGSTPAVKSWKITDAHEFGHKLGLKHRTDGGIMDYEPLDKPDNRKLLASDIQRIISLYQ